tara:strand:+ start:5933 stop:9067 length:3135 start_codon:yes stop_codon:yes gene_type:complete
MAVNKNFVVKHGLEVKQDLLYADAQLERVGIGTTLAYHKLQVSGDLKVDSDAQIVGVTSLGTNTKIIDGTLEAGNTGVGTYGQFLIATGAGIAWTTAPKLRKVETFTALDGQKQFNFAHTLGFLDVFLNGVKLSTSEYTETAAFVTLLNGATAGDTVELIGYYLFDNIGAANTTGIQGITVLEENTITGTPSQVTSINFQGAHVTAAGTGAGVTVTFLGAGVGIASSGTQIGYGFTNLNFVGSGNTFAVNGQTIDISISSGSAAYWRRDINYHTGIHTTSDVGIGSTVPKGGHALDVEGVVNSNTYYSNPKVLDKTITTKADHNCFAAGPYAVESGRTLTVGQDSTFTLVGGSGGASVGIQGQWLKNSVGVHTSNNVGIGTTNPLTAVGAGNTFVLHVGIVTANYFYGDGRYLTNVGVAVSTSAPSNPVEGNLWWNENLGRGFIYYDAANAWVDFAPAGGGGGGIGIGGGGGGSGTGFFSNQQTNSGIHTTALNVGIGTTNPRFQLEVGPVGAAGTSLWVNGNARVTGILTVGTGSIVLDGDENRITVGAGVTIDTNGVVAGLGTVNYIDATHINATGVVTATSFEGDGSGLTGISSAYWEKTTAGINTSSAVGIGVTNPAGMLEVQKSGIPAIISNYNDSKHLQMSVGDNGGGFNVTTGNFFAIQHQPYADRGSDNNLTERFRITSGGDITIGGDVTAAAFSGSGAGLTGLSAAQLTGALPAIDGSALTGVTAVGTGISVQDSGSQIGVAATINFGANLSVSPVSAGIVTVTANGGAGFFAQTSVGIHTLSSVGVGTTNPTEPLTVAGLTSTSDLHVTGIATITEAIVGSAVTINSGGIVAGLSTFNNFNSTHINAGIITATSVVVGSGVTVNASGLNVAGIATALTFSGQVSSGVGTFTTLKVGTGGTVVNALATGSVGVATTNPVSTFQVERFGVQTGFGTFAATAGVTTFIDSFTISSTDFRTAEYTVHVESASSIQAQKVLVMQNGSTAYSQEWAVMSHPDLLVSIGATVSSGAVRLNVTPETGVSGIITYRFTRNAML